MKPKHMKQPITHFSVWFYLSFLSILLLTVVSCKPSQKTALAQVDMSCQPREISAFQGERVVFSFSMTNRQHETIRTEANFFLSYHLYDEKGKLVTFDNRRYGLPRVLRRNKTTTFDIPIFFSYPRGGKYVVEFDIVKEGAYWGSEKQWQTCKVNLNLKPLVSPEFKQNYLKSMITTDNPLFEQWQYLLRLTLKNGERYTPDQQLFGFVAGSDYPQLWIRDTATFIPYTLLYYPAPVLISGVEQFLFQQGVEGDIVDWVDLAGQTGKNTVETDQESSLVLAAAPLAAANPIWLTKEINNKTVLQRLILALDWVWEKKRDAELQMITSGFTADWGDTENSYPDQRATQLSDKSTMVCSIYTQAKYLQAMQALIRLLQFNKKPDTLQQTEIKKWTQRITSLKQQTVQQLYLQERGYFITHIVPGENRQKYFLLEQEMVPVGGNAEAILAGLMNKTQIQKFIAVLNTRRQQYQLRTVSFTLLPPYPEGFFPHHLLSHPWSYQNGGEWDWIGARVVKALLINGFRQEALAYLQEIAQKNMANYCIYEWEDRNGVGRGALFYIGAAGLLGENLILAYPH